MKNTFAITFITAMVLSTFIKASACDVSVDNQRKAITTTISGFYIWDYDEAEYACSEHAKREAGRAQLPIESYHCNFTDANPRGTPNYGYRLTRNLTSAEILISKCLKFDACIANAKTFEEVEALKLSLGFTKYCLKAQESNRERIRP